MDEKQDAPDGFAKLKWQEEKQLRTRPGRFSQERLERKSRREEVPQLSSMARHESIQGVSERGGMVL